MRSMDKRAAWRPDCMKFINVILLCLVAAMAMGCNKKEAKDAAAKTGREAHVTVDPETRETAVDTEKGRVVTRAGKNGGGEVEYTDEKSGVTHKFKSGGAQGRLTVTDGKGAVSTFGTDVSVTAADLGIAFYPGGKITFGIKSGSAQPGSVSRASLTTSDAYEKPRDFYTRATPHAAFHHKADSEQERMDMWTWQGGDFQYSVVVRQPLPRGEVEITLEKMRAR